MSDKCAELKEKADKDYANYETTKDHESDPDQFYMSEVYIVDDKEYFKTYYDEYKYWMPHGLIPRNEDYIHSYGQKCQFMLLKDFDESYTWYGKDWTQEQINAEYERRDQARA